MDECGIETTLGSDPMKLKHMDSFLSLHYPIPLAADDVHPDLIETGWEGLPCVSLKPGGLSIINSRVLMEDELWILGDFSFKITREQAVEWRKEIRCRHVHLVIGNHDKNYEEQGVFETVQNYKELKTPKGKVILFHYPIADWNCKYHGALHLHGHIHSTGEYNEKNVESGNRIYDVGVDANDYYPVKLEEIMDKFGM